MTREENILFGLYTWRVGLLTREQLLAILGSLKSGPDVDLGKSLEKRGMLTTLHADALWAFVHAQAQKLGGDVQACVGTIPMDDDVKQAVLASLLAGAMANKDPQTVRFPPRDKEA